jgi:hypothetical protein
MFVQECGHYGVQLGEVPGHMLRDHQVFLRKPSDEPWNIGDTDQVYIRPPGMPYLPTRWGLLYLRLFSGHTA